MNLTTDEAKRAARVLRADLPDLSHSQALEILDLSDHHGDGTPGSVVWVPVTDVHALHRELSTKDYPRQRPGVEEHAPGGPTLAVTDPFANLLRICQEVRP